MKVTREHIDEYLADKKKLDSFFQILAEQAAVLFQIRWNRHAEVLSSYYGDAGEFFADVLSKFGYSTDGAMWTDDGTLTSKAKLKSFKIREDGIYVYLEWYIGYREYDYADGEVPYDDLVMSPDGYREKVEKEVAEKKAELEATVAQIRAEEEAEEAEWEKAELERLKAKYEGDGDPDEAEERARLAELRMKFEMPILKRHPDPVSGSGQTTEELATDLMRGVNEHGAQIEEEREKDA